MEFTPGAQMNENGDVVPNFDKARVRNLEVRDDTNFRHSREQDQADFVFNEQSQQWEHKMSQIVDNTNRFMQKHPHALDMVDRFVSDELTSPFAPRNEKADLTFKETTDSVYENVQTHLYNIVGSDKNYQKVMKYAMANYEPAVIAQYNKSIEDLDVQTSQNMLVTFMNNYNSELK